MHRLTGILAVLVVASGCAFNPQQASLAPVLNVAESKEGAGIAVSLRVLDERPSKSLGRRGTVYGAAAEITSAEEVGAVVQRYITDGLKRKGFEVVEWNDTRSPRLTVELRLLEYSTSTGFWTGGVQIQGTLKAIAGKDGKTYEQMYRSDKQERVAVVPTAEVNERWINDALTDVLNQLFQDSALFLFITG